MHFPLFFIGTASLDPKANGKISGLSLGYISGTNIISAVIGIALTLAIRPGKNMILKSVLKSNFTCPKFEDLVSMRIFHILIC